jgi:hypothetical protein
MSDSYRSVGFLHMLLGVSELVNDGFYSRYCGVKLLRDLTRIPIILPIDRLFGAKPEIV